MKYFSINEGCVAKKIIIIFLIIISGKSSFTQKLNVALFYENSIKTVIFSVISGEYDITGDGIQINRSATSESYFISSENNLLSIRNSEKSFGVYGKIEFTAADSSGIFQLTPEEPLMNPREYDDDLAIVSNSGHLQLINKINIEKYITGVIETEGGSFAPSEFYKAQAILIRTYAIKNMYRHSGSGYNLCDATHCQAYKGKSRLNNLIYEAAEKTKGMVLTDENKNLIITPYHSNCGGLTSNASDVWQKNLPYLVMVRDPFCSQSSNATWIRKILVSDWEHYLRKNGINIKNPDTNDYTFNQPTRKKYYHLNGQQILLTRLREDWDLKSTYFSIIENGNTLILKGKGFGHGVGLCQEGAIEMARVGYTYRDILHFYFHNVQIACYNDIINH